MLTTLVQALATKVLAPRKPKLTRSAQWPKVRAEHLKTEPVCRVCGTAQNLNVHHVIPVHVNESGELEPLNLITLCEGKDGCGCHFLFGHLRNWVSWNPNVFTDARLWREKIRTRPILDKGPV